MLLYSSSLRSSPLRARTFKPTQGEKIARCLLTNSRLLTDAADTDSNFKILMYENELISDGNRDFFISSFLCAIGNDMR